MIPNSGCNPHINIVEIGAHLLKILKHAPCEILKLLENCSTELSVSIDHVILSLDWLYTISAIERIEGEIYINDFKNIKDKN